MTGIDANSPVDGESVQGADEDRGHGRFTRIAVLFACVTTIGLFFVFCGERISLEAAVAAEGQLRSFTEQYVVLALAIAFAMYVVVTGLSLPGAAMMTLVCGWLFGFVPSLVLVSFASTAGATLAFLLSRYLFREAVQSKFADRLAAFDAALEREGAFYLFSLRLIVVVPFFVINLVMGLTPIKARTFWWVSQLGMLPGSIAYVWAGSSVPTLRDIQIRGIGGVLTWQLIAAFALLGILPLAVRRAVGRLRPGESEPSQLS
ncbi:MAG: TVP38/TMEM64 family protein [Pirellulales bacterium]